MHAREKEMATHSSIPGTEEPGGLPSMGSQLLSMGSHRVRHDWSDLAAAAAILFLLLTSLQVLSYFSSLSLSLSLFLLTIYILFIYLFTFIFISWRLITLQYCSGFAIHWHEHLKKSLLSSLFLLPTSSFLITAPLLHRICSTINSMFHTI